MNLTGRVSSHKKAKADAEASAFAVKRLDVRSGNAFLRPDGYQSSYGMITASMTWITPLLVSMSVVTTLAPSTITPPSDTSISTSEP